MPRLSNVRRSLGLLLSVGIVGLAACSESTAPPTVGDLAVAQAANASARRTSGATTNKETTGTTTSGTTTTGTTTTVASVPTTTIKFAPGVTLSTYDTSFAVVVGTSSTHQVMYKGTYIPFLKLEIPANADFFDANGVTLKNGTKVQVTVAIDPVYASVRFGPHGTIFKRYPAKVCLNYFGLDLGGRSPSSFAVWYQPDTTTAWSAQATQLDVSFWWLCASLSHFSNYAVAY